jgi:CHAD domain-containing protein
MTQGILVVDFHHNTVPRPESNLRSDVAIKQLLAQVLDSMERNEAGIEANQTPEFLHDFRVAVRRCRSIMGEIKQVIPVRILKRIQCNLSWLNQVTGPVRDIDVYLKNLSIYQSNLSVDIQKNLQPLREHLLKNKKDEYIKLVQAIHSPRYFRFKIFLRNYSNRPTAKRTLLGNAKVPITVNCDKRIWRVLKRVIKTGDNITKHSTDEELHDMRKKCKNLRYLLEFCRNAYLEKDVTRLIHELKQLQDSLGEYHDYSVEIIATQDLTRQMRIGHNINENAEQAINCLIDNIQQKQHKARKKYKKAFAKLSSKENQSTFKRLFKPGKHAI